MEIKAALHLWRIVVISEGRNRMGVSQMRNFGKESSRIEDAVSSSDFNSKNLKTNCQSSSTCKINVIKTQGNTTSNQNSWYETICTKDKWEIHKVSENIFEVQMLSRDRLHQRPFFEFSQECRYVQ